MLFLFTGQPGSQKTANMINFVMSDSQFSNRPVYYYNIKECTVPDWVEITEEQVKEWYTLPEGSVLLIDEAQRIFRPTRSTVPDSTVTELETHRHHGFDIIMTTQHPMLINSDVRRQVQQHRHYKKPYGLRTACHVWEKCVSDPEAQTNVKEADKLSGKVPQSVFQLYKSTVLDTHKKKRIPKMLYVFIALVFFVVGMGLYLLNDFSNRMQSEEGASAEVTSAVTSALPGTQKLKKSDGEGFKPMYPLDPVEYAQLFTPRIPSAPHTAPVYDELVKPTVAPKTRCYGHHSSDGYKCRCVTQQHTPVEMPYRQCVSIVNNGLWDPAPITQANYTATGQIM
ncbi:MAG: AAA family ATPase [Oceanospirillales bacterium]|nr:AAA family ATPase [Oceanospirillales bacterium]